MGAMNKNTDPDLPTGVSWLHDPLLNKSTAFTMEERNALRLRGLLPPRVCSQDQQVGRVLGNYRKQPNDLARYVHLISLQDRNETLFYRLIQDHLEEMLPIIYTPTVGQACQEYGHIFQRPRGLFVSIEDRGRVAEVLSNWPKKKVSIIVVTDGERILGLGDLGANGMGIPVGKLSLYTACAGIHPSTCLPITLDVGTNNEELRNDPLYLGLGRPRVRGEEYDAFLEEFVTAVQEAFPDAILQFEDFANVNAFPLLARYRDRVRCFNDDIQGTASVTLAGLYSALRITGGTLAEKKVLFLGAGAAGIGVADLVSSAMQQEGLTEAEARSRCWLVDSKGLVVKGREDLTDNKRRYAHEGESAPDLLAAVQAIRPHALIGVAGRPKMFTREVVESMADINERPIIFSLSNPTSKTECTAEEAYRWTRGRAVFASGSPFDPLTLDGKTFVPGQGNNAYIFPGVGLGVLASRARLVVDEMFFVAARTLAHLVTEADLEQGSIFPPLHRIQEVSAAIGTAVAEVAFARRLAAQPPPADLRAHVESLMYRPEYPSYA
jgi:malate dehydrogenase (oxaloacetate-decarboxylating)(NADP+)